MSDECTWPSCGHTAKGQCQPSVRIYAIPADAPPEPVDTLLFDAYKALLVLHRMLDSVGLTLGIKAAEQIADRIVSANPDFLPRAAAEKGTPK